MKRWQLGGTAFFVVAALICLWFGHRAYQIEHPAAAVPPAVTTPAVPVPSTSSPGPGPALSTPTASVRAVTPSSPTVTAASPTTVPPSTPIWLGIKARNLQVAATVVPISLAQDGFLYPPPNPTVGWWKQRGRPGSADTTYLAGHAVSGHYGVFGQLGKLERGDTIELITQDSSGERYRLMYHVTNKLKHPFGWQGDDVAGVHPNTLILIACTDYQGAGRYDSNWYIAATLS